MTNSSHSLQSEPRVSAYVIVWAAVFGVLAVVTVTFNALTIAAFLKIPSRRRVHAHLFLINLAVADLMVGASAIPMFIAILVLHDRPPAINTGLRAVDITFGLASIFTLTMMALERCYAVYRPYRFLQITRKTYLVSFPIPWSAAVLVTITMLISYHSATALVIFRCILYTSFGVPVLVISLVYPFIWVKVKLQPQHRFGRGNVRLATTLLITILVFLITWLPFIVINLLVPYNYSVSPDALSTVKFLHYCNSAMNPIIYCLRIPDFRQAMSSIICVHKRQRGERNFQMETRDCPM